MVTDFWHTPPSFCVLAFHSGLEDCNTDVHVDTTSDPSTSGENLVNVWSSNPELCMCVCTRYKHRALPRISSFVIIWLLFHICSAVAFWCKSLTLRLLCLKCCVFMLDSIASLYRVACALFVVSDTPRSVSFSIRHVS